MHYTSFSPLRITLHHVPAAHFALYTTLTERAEDTRRLQAWLKTKQNNKQKKQPKFDLRSYAVKTGETDVHALKVGGLRNPYDLQVSSSHIAAVPLSGRLEPCIYVGKT